MRAYAFLSLTLALLLATPIWAQNKKKGNEEVTPPKAEKVDPVKLKADYSYAIGLNVGRSLKADEVDVDLAQVLKGLGDGVKGAKPALTDEQLEACMTALQRQVQTRGQAKVQAVADKNKAEGEAFLAANKKKEGVKTTPSGLQYKVLKAGKGPSPKLTDKVTTHYHGTFLDGKVFDSSVDRKEPASFPVNRVIAGWTEALQMMKVGDKWQLFVPSNLAYQEEGRDGIPPNSTLIFEVELLGIGE